MSRYFGASALDIAVHLAKARARELAEALARQAERLFSGVTAEARPDGVALTGKRLKRRLLTDALLRRPYEWLSYGSRR